MCRKHLRTVAWVLVVVMTYSPSMAWAQPPAAAEPSPAEGKKKIDLGLITPNTVAAAILYPRQVLTAPQAEMLPTEVFVAAGKQQLGINPLEIEQVVAIADLSPGGPPQAAVVLHMEQPLAEGKILAPLWNRTTEAELDGKTYRRGTGTMDFSIFRADDRTLILAHDGLLRKIVSNRATPQEGAMSRTLGRITEPADATAILLVEPLRPLLALPLAMAPVPPPFADVKKIPGLLASIEAKVSLTGSGMMSLVLKANDEAAAEQLEQVIDKLLAAARQATAAEMAKTAKQSGRADPVQQASAHYAKRMSDRMSQLLRPVRKGRTLTLATDPAGKNQQMTQVAMIGVLVALLLPAVQAAREAARRMQSINNMKQVLLAMHNYHSMHNAFPARASFDKEGKPLLSWRVHMLPLLGQQALYRQFHLDEPWDSEHNRKLIPLMPKIYENPSQPRPGMAHYLAVCGEGLAFEGNEGRALKDFRDGAANTILIVEVNADHAVTWTKPDDWQYDEQKPLAGLGAAHPAGFNAGFADGSVRFLSNKIDPTAFHAMLTIAGGESVPPGGTP